MIQSTKSIGNIVMAVMILTSLFVGSIGTVSAQSTADRAYSCVENAEQNASILSFALGGTDLAYYCVSGAWNADEVGSMSTAELQDSAWSASTNIEDATDTRQKEYDQWGDKATTVALQEAEGPVIDAHYAEKSEAEARSEGLETVREYFAQQKAKEIKQHNANIELSYSLSKNTYKATDVDPVVYWYYESGTTTNRVVATDNSDLVYQTVTLEDGSEIDKVVAITNVKAIDASQGDDVAIVFDDVDSINGTSVVSQPSPFDAPHILSKDSNGDYTDSLPGLELTRADPYTSETSTISWTQGHIQRINDLENQRETAVKDLRTMVSDLYQNRDKGTINPDEYVSPSTMTDRYNSDNSHYSYPTAMAASLGFDTNVKSSQIIEIDGQEYEGTILVDGNASGLQPIADSSASQDGTAYLNYTSTDSQDIATASLEVNADTITSVDYVQDDAYSVDGTTVTIEKGGLTQDYVLISAEMTNPETGDTVTQRLLQFADENTANKYNGIPTGLVSGNTYSVSEFDTVMLSYQNGDTADTMTVTSDFTVKSIQDAETGNEVQAVGYTDGVDRDFTQTSNLTEELNRLEDIQNAMSERSDVDPAGAGGVGDVQQRLSDVLAGIGIAGFIALILIVLALIGRITSVN